MRLKGCQPDDPDRNLYPFLVMMDQSLESIVGCSHQNPRMMHASQLGIRIGSVLSAAFFSDFISMRNECDGWDGRKEVGDLNG